MSTTLVNDKNKRTLVEDKGQGLLSAAGVNDSCQPLSMLCYTTLYYALPAMLAMRATRCYACYVTLRYATRATLALLCCTSYTLLCYNPHAGCARYAMLAMLAMLAVLAC